MVLLYDESTLLPVNPALPPLRVTFFTPDGHKRAPFHKRANEDGTWRALQQDSSLSEWPGLCSWRLIGERAPQGVPWRSWLFLTSESSFLSFILFFQTVLTVTVTYNSGILSEFLQVLPSLYCKDNTVVDSSWSFTWITYVHLCGMPARFLEQQNALVILTYDAQMADKLKGETWINEREHKCFRTVKWLAEDENGAWVIRRCQPRRTPMGDLGAACQTALSAAIVKKHQSEGKSAGRMVFIPPVEIQGM